MRGNGLAAMMDPVTFTVPVITAIMFLNYALLTCVGSLNSMNGVLSVILGVNQDDAILSAVLSKTIKLTRFHHHHHRPILLSRFLTSDRFFVHMWQEAI